MVKKSAKRTRSRTICKAPKKATKGKKGKKSTKTPKAIKKSIK